jgi:uncharacterized protein (DUF169 family)
MAISTAIHQALAFYIRPSTFPVGVLPLPKLADGPPDLVKKAKAPKRDMGHTITVCMGVGMARRYGWTMLVRREDNACPLGGIAMGFEPAKEKFWRILVAPLHAGEFEPALTIDYLRSDQG